MAKLSVIPTGDSPPPPKAGFRGLEGTWQLLMAVDKILWLQLYREMLGFFSDAERLDLGI